MSILWGVRRGWQTIRDVSRGWTGTKQMLTSLEQPDRPVTKKDSMKSNPIT